MLSSKKPSDALAAAEGTHPELAKRSEDLCDIVFQMAESYPEAFIHSPGVRILKPSAAPDICPSAPEAAEEEEATGESTGPEGDPADLPYELIAPVQSPEESADIDPFVPSEKQPVDPVDMDSDHPLLPLEECLLGIIAPASEEKKPASPPPAAAKAGRPLLHSAQASCLAQMMQMADVFLNGDWREDGIGIAPRLCPLVVGPSGCGKTHLALLLGIQLKMEVQRLSYGEWLVTGARAEPATLETISKFVSKHPKGIIYIDELDKCRAGFSTDWSSSMMQELFGLIDGTVSVGAWTKNLREKLKTKFFIIGSGTWQEIWTQEKRVGFGGGDPLGFDHAAVSERIVTQRLIPEELLLRFNGQPLLLPPLAATELRRMAVESGLDASAQTVGLVPDYDAGARSRKGMRWLEEIRTKVLLSKLSKTTK